MTFRLVFPTRIIPIGGGTAGLAEYLLERITERLQLGPFLLDAGTDETAFATSLRSAASKIRGILGAAQEGSTILLREDEIRALRLVAIPPSNPPVGAYWQLATTLRALFVQVKKK